MVLQQMINNQFWIGKKIFLTGHTGFKGAWLSHWLDHLGAQTVGFSKYTNPQQKDLAGSVETFFADSVVGDICCRKQSDRLSSTVATRYCFSFSCPAHRQKVVY